MCVPRNMAPFANSQDLRWICEDAGDQQVRLRDLDDLDGAVSVTVVAFWQPAKFFNPHSRLIETSAPDGPPRNPTYNPKAPRSHWSVPHRVGVVDLWFHEYRTVAVGCGG